MQHIVSESGYKPVKVIVQNQDEYAQLLMKAKTELNSFKNRYERIVELEEVIRAIDNL